MAGGSLLVGLGGAEVWANVEAVDGGLRMRLSVDDWERQTLYRGQRIAVRVPGEALAMLYVADITDLPPVVLVTLADRVRAVG